MAIVVAGQVCARIVERWMVKRIERVHPQFQAGLLVNGETPREHAVKRNRSWAAPRIAGHIAQNRSGGGHERCWVEPVAVGAHSLQPLDRKSTRLNSSHSSIS